MFHRGCFFSEQASLSHKMFEKCCFTGNHAFYQIPRHVLEWCVSVLNQH